MTDSKGSSKNKQLNNQIPDFLDQFAIKLVDLSYEESIIELDSILTKMQAETVPVEELKINYLKAHLYIEHCEKLLKNIEQEIIEINNSDLDKLINK